MKVRAASDEDVVIVHGVTLAAIEGACQMTHSTRTSMIVMFTVQLATMLRQLMPNETRPSSAKLLRAMADAVEQGEQNALPTQAHNEAIRTIMMDMMHMLQLIDTQQKGKPS